MRSMTGSIILTRPSLRLIIVAALHVALIYIVNDALRFEWPTEKDRRTTAWVMPDKPPALVDPDRDKDAPGKMFTIDPIPPPEPIPDEETTEAVPADSSAVTGTAGEHGNGSGQPEPRITPVRADPRYPLTRADYPVVSIRGGEEGVVELSVYVLRDGRIADVRVAKSSGYARLDRAAVEEARRRWRMQPALRGDEPIDAWGNFRVVFRIETH